MSESIIQLVPSRIRTANNTDSSSMFEFFYKGHAVEGLVATNYGSWEKPQAKILTNGNWVPLRLPQTLLPEIDRNVRLTTEQEEARLIQAEENIKEYVCNWIDQSQGSLY